MSIGAQEIRVVMTVAVEYSPSLAASCASPMNLPDLYPPAGRQDGGGRYAHAPNAELSKQQDVACGRWLTHDTFDRGSFTAVWTKRVSAAE